MNLMQEQGQKYVYWVDQIHKAVRILRHGPREAGLTLLGLLFLASSKGLPDSAALPEVLRDPLNWVRWSLIFLGLSCLALASWKVWAKAVAPLPAAGSKPAAIKGASAFGPQDAELFSQLGRSEELGHLRNWILDDQVPLIAVMGESGVGKTSLLRAGLADSLRDDGVECFYWEARQVDDEGDLPGFLRARLVPDAEREVVSATDVDASPKFLIVIDQLEQILPEGNHVVFSLLARTAAEPAPHKTTWLVAFRREYMPSWREFELGFPAYVRSHFETLSLKRFSLPMANRVMAVLAEASELSLGQNWVAELLLGLSGGGTVSPVDIGISLLIISDKAAVHGSSDKVLSVLRGGSGQVGLFTAYLERLLENFTEVERGEILNALLALADLETNQRIAEGRTVDELTKAGCPIDRRRFVAALQFLASGKARVLESLDASGRFRLTHEKLIPALRRLTSRILAEAEQASVLFERQLRIWSQDRRRRNLLTGSELRSIQRHKHQLRSLEEASRQEFLRRSRVRQVWRVTLSSVSFLIFAAFGAMGWRYLESERHRSSLESWGLPGDLYKYKKQIEFMSLSRPVNHLKWLSDGPDANLRRLNLVEMDLDGLEGLPASLRVLSLRGSRLKHLRGLPASLVSLDLSMTNVESLEDLPEGLRHLDCESCLVKNWRNLPSGLRSLSLSGTPIKDVKRLPSSLRALDISETEVSALRDLPGSIRELSVHHTSVTKLSGLPPRLEALNAEGTRITTLMGVPNSVRALFVGDTDLRDLRGLPASIKSLSIAGTAIKELNQLLPRSLTWLSIDSSQTKVLNSLSGPLVHLRIRMPGGTIAEIYKHRTGVTVERYSEDVNISFPDMLTDVRPEVASYLTNSLESLTINNSMPSTKVNLSGLPNSVKSINLSGEIAVETSGMPANIKDIYLQGVRDLPAEFPSSTRLLLLQGVDTRHLGKLPVSLSVLTVANGKSYSPHYSLPYFLKQISVTREWDFSSFTSLSVVNLPGVELKRLILPASLKRLDLGTANITEFPGLPARLFSIDVSDTGFRNLESLPRELHELTLSVRQVRSLRGLPPTVRALHFVKSNPFFE